MSVMQNPEHMVLTAAEFGRLFVDYRERFEIIARRYVRSASVAEDLVSDSFMAFWESRARITPPITDSACASLIFTILRNRCLDYLRAQSLHLKIESEINRFHKQLIAEDIHSLEAIEPKELFSGEVHDLVNRALETLPEQTRLIFIAHRFSGESYREIAARFGISERRVEFELVKAVKQLRLHLKDYLPVLLLLTGTLRP